MTLKQRLEKYIKNKNVFVSSGELQRLVAEKTTYTPSNCSRRLRELENEGALEVKYIKGHAWYHWAETRYWTNQESIDFFDNYQVTT